MTEEDERRRSSEEQLESEGSGDEFSKCGKSKITYTRALLLEFTETNACRKLPEDFDLLLLGELSAAADVWAENRMISGNPSIVGVFSSVKWDTGVPKERGDNHLLAPSEKSHWRVDCSSEKSDVVSQQLSRESGCEADQKIPESGSFQLKRSQNPYRPPHCNKKLQQPSNTFSDLGVESSESSTFSSVASNQIDCADSASVNEEPGKNEVSDATDKPEMEIIDNDQPTNEDLCGEISEKQLCECESSLNLGIIDDGITKFEDLWDDILESLRQQEEAEPGPTPAPDSEIEICLLDHDYNADIIWPDEDTLISVQDMIAPYSSLPTFDSDFVETDKQATSNMTAVNGQNLESLNGKPFFHLGNNEHVNPNTKPNFIPYMPTLNFYTYSNLLYSSCLNSTNPVSQYSVFQQPNIFAVQPNFPLIDMWSGNQLTHYQGFETPNAGSILYLPRL